MKAKRNKKKYILLILLPIILINIIVFRLYLNKNKSSLNTKPSEELFLAPGKNWHSPKKVEDYFSENMNITKQEAVELRKQKSYQGRIKLRLRETNNLDELLNDLEVYGFIRSKNSLLYALINTNDNLPGHANPIMVDKNTIDIWAYYEISEDMSAWEIADQLLNHPNYFAYDDENKLFTP